jgi:hypothetical protein
MHTCASGYAHPQQIFFKQCLTPCTSSPVSPVSLFVVAARAGVGQIPMLPSLCEVLPFL